MKYYRVKPENDNRRRFKFHRGGGLEIDGIWIANELYTPKEISKYPGGVTMCEPVEISRRKIYWLFGARFEFDNGPKAGGCMPVILGIIAAVFLFPILVILDISSKYK